MILEELIGCCIAFVSSIVFQTPPIFHQNVLEENWLINEDGHEDGDEYDGLVHSEYEQQGPNEAPYYEDGSFVSSQAEHPREGFCESFRRSFRANIGILIAVVFMLSLFTVGVVFVDLNANDICIEWVNKNVTLPSYVRTLRIVGMSAKLLSLYSWFPTCVAMLFGFRRFKENYFWRLFLCEFLIGSVSCIYKIIMFDKLSNLNFTLFR